ncbi:unnamed protein product [Cuscuta campestris]|uniref:Uncharacterized protein n=1 Tax=Cuscuta campestris TaxID=132261 RepID=A0A484KED3_9ASTE|nr:unnamed protein product [Cuscuta campestris]
MKGQVIVSDEISSPGGVFMDDAQPKGPVNPTTAPSSMVLGTTDLGFNPSAPGMVSSDPTPGSTKSPPSLADHLRSYITPHEPSDAEEVRGLAAPPNNPADAELPLCYEISLILLVSHRFSLEAWAQFEQNWGSIKG